MGLCKERLLAFKQSPQVSNEWIRNVDTCVGTYSPGKPPTLPHVVEHQGDVPARCGRPSLDVEKIGVWWWMDGLLHFLLLTKTLFSLSQLSFLHEPPLLPSLLKQMGQRRWHLQHTPILEMDSPGHQCTASICTIRVFLHHCEAEKGRQSGDNRAHARVQYGQQHRILHLLLVLL